MYRSPGGRSDWRTNPWTTLSLYQNLELLSERYEYRHQCALEPEKAFEIAAHITQGRDYFFAAAEAGELARPLLLYYGVLALSRASILFAISERRESSLKPGHGLGERKWDERFEKDLAKTRLNDLHLEIRQSGTFQELVEATGNREWTMARWEDQRPSFGSEVKPRYSGYMGWMAGANPLQPKQCVTFGDLVGRIPDLGSFFEETTGDPSLCFPSDLVLSRGPHNMGPDVLPSIYAVGLTVHRNYNELPERKSLAKCLNLDWEDSYGYLQNPKQSQHFIRDLDDHLAIAEQLPHIRSNTRGGSYVVAPWRDGTMLSTLPLLFALSYAVGMMVRYHPTSWHLMASVRDGNRAFPLLRELVGHIQQQFPIELADFLERKYLPTGEMKELPSGKVF